MSGSHVNWRGGQVEDEIISRISDGLVEVGLRIEGEAKKQLKPGHGKVTGTLQRSVHAADPNYGFGKDHVESSKDSPERGGQAPKPRRSGNRLIIAVGSGMEYAMRIQQLYKFLTIAYDKVKPIAMSIVSKHVAGR